MLRLSKAHLTEVGETYFQHMKFALFVGTLAIGAGTACVLHAMIPALCQRTCSRAVASLQGLFADRTQLEAVAAENSALVIFVILTALSCVTSVALCICTAGSLVGLVVIPQAFALPVIFLSQNHGLEPVDA